MYCLLRTTPPLEIVQRCRYEHGGTRKGLSHDQRPWLSCEPSYWSLEYRCALLRNLYSVLNDQVGWTLAVLKANIHRLGGEKI